MTEQERLKYINTTCNTNYKSMDEINWYYISKKQNLSESFIREFKNKVNWEDISERQNLSKEFLREFKDKIYWKSFFNRDDMQEILIDKMIN